MDHTQTFPPLWYFSFDICNELVQRKAVKGQCWSSLTAGAKGGKRPTAPFGAAAPLQAGKLALARQIQSAPASNPFLALSLERLSSVGQMANIFFPYQSLLDSDQ